MGRSLRSEKEGNRFLVKWQFDHGQRNPSKISRHTHVPLPTVKTYLRKLRRGESLDDKPRSGRPRIVDTTFRRRLAQLKSIYPEKASRFFTRLMHERYDVEVSERTVQRTLNQMDYSWQLPPRNSLTSAQKQSRLAFVEAHSEDVWDKTWAFDECYFNLYRNTNRLWVKVTTSDSFSRPKLTSRQEKVSVGIAVAISRGKKSTIAFLPKNWNGGNLIDLFERSLLPSINWPRRPNKRQRWLMDNDGRHQERVWKEYAERKALDVIEPCPATSPDLNPIENVFSWLKTNVESAHPTDEASLCAAIEEAWDTFPIDFTISLMDSIPTRLSLVRAKRRARTKY